MSKVKHKYYCKKCFRWALGEGEYINDWSWKEIGKCHGRFCGKQYAVPEEIVWSCSEDR